MLFLVVILVIGGFAVYVMTPAERKQLADRLLGLVHQTRHAAAQHRLRKDPFRDALLARTRWPLVAPAVAGVNVLLFLAMLVGAGSLSDPQTLVGWGANYGPRTTNAEWWRLVTSMFVHGGPIHLLVNLVVLLQLGLLLERLVGHLAFGGVYFAAGLFGGVVSLSASPLGVAIGGSAGLFGLYGLLVATAIWGLVRRSDLTLPLASAKPLGGVAAVFLLYSAANGGMDTAAEVAGFIVGAISGLVLARGVSEQVPPVRRVAATIAATVVIAAAASVPLRGVVDVRPEIERLVAVEDRTAGIYEAQVERFKKGTVSAEALAQLIVQKIVPDLTAAQAKLNTITRVLPEHQPLLASAQEYFRLRYESWRLRAEGLQRHDMLALRKADRIELESLEAYERVRPGLP